MLAYIPDILLISISACTCFYCLVLARRLKNLQSLESGIGASILALSEAIATTNAVALDARLSTQDSVKHLQDLISQADRSLPQLEARTQSLHNARRTADSTHAALEELMTSAIEPGLKNVQESSKTLLQIIRAVKIVERRAQSVDLKKAKHIALSPEQERAA